MKLPLFTAEALGFTRDMITFSVKYGSLPPLFSKAIVDTGCPVTFLPEWTLQRTRIPYTKLKLWSGGAVFALGLLKLKMRELGKCKLVFKDESGNPVEIEHEVFVGVPIQRVENLGSSFPAF